MAQSVQLQTIRGNAARYAHQTVGGFWTSAEWNAAINLQAQRLYDRLVAAGPPEYYATDATLTTVAGTLASSLPAGFRSLVGVFAQEGSTARLRELYPVRGGTRLAYDAPQGAYAVTLRYVPTYTAMSGDSDTLDAVSGWDNLVALLAARDALMAEQVPTDQVQQLIAEEEARVSQMAPRRGGGPRFVRELGDEWPYWASNPICAYELRAGSIELFQRSVWP